MDNIKKPSFLNLVKSEIQDLDESLSSIPNLWGEEPTPLTETLRIRTESERVSLTFNPKYELSPSVRQKVQEIFSSDRWA